MLSRSSNRFDQLLLRQLEIVVGFEACEVNEVDGAGAGHDVNGEGEDEDAEETEDSGEVVAGVLPELLPELLLFTSDFSNFPGIIT